MATTKLAVCQKCWGTGLVYGGDEKSAWSKSCEDCHGIGYVRVPMTNADRIRATDDELATMLHAIKMGYAPWCDHHCENEGDDGCDNCIKEWLKQPAEGE